MNSKKNEILILTGSQVSEILEKNHEKIIETIKKAYTVHEMGKSSLPHSVFLRFEDNPRNRIIGLPAYLGQDFAVAGIKWIASFPENINKKMDRASATIILNSLETGRPYGILEGSIISAKRTAASAALAATLLADKKKINSISFIGCGLINFEIFRFLEPLFKDVKTIYLHDLIASRSELFAKKVKSICNVKVEICQNLKEALNASKLVSFATTSAKPYVTDSSSLQDGVVYLHISLRDLSPELIQKSTNIVDDKNHVNRENTSIHLAFQKFSNTEFITQTIGGLLLTKNKIDISQKPVIVSPFGLGFLDLALANYVYTIAAKENIGTKVENFLPEPYG